MKKMIIFSFVSVLMILCFSPVSAFSGSRQIDNETELSDDDYYAKLEQCFSILDNYKEDLDSVYSGEIQTISENWHSIRDNLRWDVGVTCGYIMAAQEPEELSDYAYHIFMGAYHEIAAVEFYIQCISNDNDPKLYDLYQEMLSIAEDFYSYIPLRGH
ncbi:MAG TPA: hypothetical protein PK721_05850 [Flexilinea sp.]|nr:hypothetical protein [Flexilinea sp.]